VSGHKGTRRADVRPCGTEAAYRRHLRRGEDVDLACRQWRDRDWEDRSGARSEVLRSRWAALRDAGYAPAEVQRAYQSAARTAAALAAARGEAP